MYLQHEVLEQAGLLRFALMDQPGYLISTQAGYFEIECDGLGVDQWRWITAAGFTTSQSAISDIEVPEPSNKMMLAFGIMFLCVMRRIRISSCVFSTTGIRDSDK
ncbi:MAG: hypothetical protein GY910_20600 [bacterium]|nr:hypothetical protein [bacterium]